MQPFNTKRNIFKQLIINIQLWHFWHQQKRAGDCLAQKICKMHSFWDFMLMDIV